MNTGLWKVPSCGKPRSKTRAFPQLLENADEAGVSHTSHSPRCYKTGSISFNNLSSMSPVFVLDVLVRTPLTRGEGRSIDSARDAPQPSTLLPRFLGEKVGPVLVHR